MSTIPPWLQSFQVDVQNEILRFLALPVPERIVAIDGDGALWNEHIGEDFLARLTGVPPKRIDPPPLPENLWTAYKAIDHTPDQDDAFEKSVFRVRAMAGLSLERTIAWANDCVHGWTHGKEKIARLVAGLRGEGCRVYVTTHSWEPLVRLLVAKEKIEVDGIFGVRSECDDIPGQGLVLTDRMIEPVICNGGKVTVLDEAGIRPALVIANNIAQNELFDVARFRVVLGTKAKKNDMVELAEIRGWPIEP